MKKKQTDQEFKDTIKTLYNDKYKILDSYTDNFTKVRIKCKNCGFIESIQPKTLKRGKTECRNCDSIYPLTTENLPGEKWKPVEDFEKVYSISNKGRLKRNGKNIETTNTYLEEIIVKVSPKKNSGYMEFKLVDGKKEKHISIHRLVALAFIDNPKPDIYNEVNHIDGDKTNNTVENLEWTDRIGNIRHDFKNGLYDVEAHKERCIQNNEHYMEGYSLIDPKTNETVKTGTLLEISKYVGLKSRYSGISDVLDKKIIYRGYYWIKNK